MARYHTFAFLLISLALKPLHVDAQILVDSIPYPGANAGFWGIHVNADTIFLGADGAGDIHFSDHSGNILGQLATGFNYNHGLVRRESSYLIAKDYTTGGALLQEIDLSGASMNTWTFPPVIGGNSSGIGDLCPDGDAVWYTMYFPDFDEFPFAYAYKWIPGDPTPIDTVPMHGEQPYGIALKGDTLFYVTDNLNGDQERIYAYDLTNGMDIGWIDLPDTQIDNDMSPRGMHYDGTHLYLIANRQGGNAFAYQTVYIYSFDQSVGSDPFDPSDRTLLVHPNPARDRVVVELPFSSMAGTSSLEVFDAMGRSIMSERIIGSRRSLDVSEFAPGVYSVRAIHGGKRMSATLVVQ